MEFKYCPVPNLHKQGLVAPVVLLFMTRQSKCYYVGGSGMGDVGIGQGGDRIQVQRFPGREPVGDLVRDFSGSRKGGVIKQRLYGGQTLGH